MIRKVMGMALIALALGACSSPPQSTDQQGSAQPHYLTPDEFWAAASKGQSKLHWQYTKDNLGQGGNIVIGQTSQYTTEVLFTKGRVYTSTALPSSDKDVRYHSDEGYTFCLSTMPNDLNGIAEPATSAFLEHIKMFIVAVLHPDIILDDKNYVAPVTEANNLLQALVNDSNSTTADKSDPKVKFHIYKNWLWRARLDEVGPTLCAIPIISPSSASQGPSAQSGASPSEAGKNGNAQAPDQVDMDALKRRVVTQVAIEHNMSPDDVIQFDAQVQPSPGEPKSYQVTGSFVLESNQPSNVYEAANQLVARNRCAVSPQWCHSTKIRHTVSFNATAAMYQKLDGTSALRITEQATVDQPAQAPGNPAATSQSAPVGPAGAPRQPTSQPAAQPLQDQDVSYASRVEPRYPPQAMRQGHQGTVWIMILVSPDGSVSDIRVDQSSGYPELDQAAIEAARRWRFHPQVRNGIAQKSTLRVPINFGLNRSQADTQPQTAEGKSLRSSAADGVPSDAPAPSQPIAAQTGSFRPSFDCAMASTPTEIAICSDQGLSIMDTNVATEYHALLNRATPELASVLKESQRAWIKTRAQCGADKGCIQQQFANRIPELRAISH